MMPINQKSLSFPRLAIQLHQPNLNGLHKSVPASCTEFKGPVLYKSLTLKQKGNKVFYTAPFMQAKREDFYYAVSLKNFWLEGYKSLHLPSNYLHYFSLPARKYKVLKSINTKFNYYVKGHAFSFLNLGFYYRPFFRTYHSAADLSSASLTMLEEGYGLKSRARGGRELIFTNFKNNKPLAKSKNSNLKASFKCENYKRGVGERWSLTSEGWRSERKPVYHLISKPNFMAGYKYSQYDRFPKHILNIKDQLSPAVQEVEIVKDHSPIFSLPNPFQLTLTPSEKGILPSNVSPLAKDLKETNNQSPDLLSGLGEKKVKASGSEIYLSGYPEGSRLSNVKINDEKLTQKKKKSMLKKEELEFNKLLTKKLTTNFVDFYQKHDFYHKLNLLKDPYKNLQIKSYLRDNFILNLIFIQNFKEFKFFEKNFHLNLNLLPTTLTEFFDVFYVQNVKEQINNYLFFVYLAGGFNQIFRPESTYEGSAAAQPNLEEDQKAKFYKAGDGYTCSATNHVTKPSGTLPPAQLAFPAITYQEPYFLDIFKKIKGLIEEDTRSYVKTIKIIKALQKLMLRAKKIENEIKHEAQRAVYLSRSVLTNNAAQTQHYELSLEDLEKGYAKAFAKVCAEEKEEELLNSYNTYKDSVEDEATKFEKEYYILIDNIIFDLYDEFKYGESLGLINKVIFKNVKNTIFQKKKINRKKGINYSIKTYLKNPYLVKAKASKVSKFIRAHRSADRTATQALHSTGDKIWVGSQVLPVYNPQPKFSSSRLVKKINKLYQSSNLNKFLFFKNSSFKDYSYCYATSADEKGAVGAFNYFFVNAPRLRLNQKDFSTATAAQALGLRSDKHFTNYQYLANPTIAYAHLVKGKVKSNNNLTAHPLQQRINSTTRGALPLPNSKAQTYTYNFGGGVETGARGGLPTKSNSRDRLLNSLNKWRFKYHGAVLSLKKEKEFYGTKNYSTLTASLATSDSHSGLEHLEQRSAKRVKNVLNISKIQNNIIFEHYTNNSLHLYKDAIKFLKKIGNYEAYGKAQWKEIILKKNLFLLSYKIKKDLREIIKSYALISSNFVTTNSTLPESGGEREALNLENIAPAPRLLLLARSHAFNTSVAFQPKGQYKEVVGVGVKGIKVTKGLEAVEAKELHMLYINKINSLKLGYILKSFSNIKPFDVYIHNNLIKLYNQYFTNPYIYNLYLVSPYTDILDPERLRSNQGAPATLRSDLLEEVGDFKEDKEIFNIVKAVKNPVFLNLLKNEKNLNLAVNSLLRDAEKGTATTVGKEKFKDLTLTKLYSDLVCDYKALDSNFSYKNIFNLTPSIITQHCVRRTDLGSAGSATDLNKKLAGYKKNITTLNIKNKSLIPLKREARDLLSDCKGGASVIVNNLLIQKLILSNFAPADTTLSSLSSNLKNLVVRSQTAQGLGLEKSNGAKLKTPTPLKKKGGEGKVEPSTHAVKPKILNLARASTSDKVGYKTDNATPKMDLRKTIITLHTEAVLRSNISNITNTSNVDKAFGAANIRGRFEQRLFENSVSAPWTARLDKKVVKNNKFLNSIPLNSTQFPLDLKTNNRAFPSHPSSSLPPALEQSYGSGAFGGDVDNKGVATKVRRLIPLLLKLRIHKDSYNKDRYDIKFRVKDAIKKKRIFNIKFRRNFNNLILKKLYLRNMIEKRIGLENYSKFLDCNLLEPIDSIFDRKILRSKGKNRLAYVNLSNRYPSISYPSATGPNSFYNYNYKVVEKRNLKFFSNLHFLWSLIGERRFKFNTYERPSTAKPINVTSLDPRLGQVHNRLPQPEAFKHYDIERNKKLAFKGVQKVFANPYGATLRSSAHGAAIRQQFKNPVRVRRKQGLKGSLKARKERSRSEKIKYIFSIRKFKRCQLKITQGVKKFKAKGVNSKFNKANNLVKAFGSALARNKFKKLLTSKKINISRSPWASERYNKNLKLNFIKKLVLDLDSQFRYQETRGLKKIKGKGKNPRVARSKKIIKKELKKTGPVNGSARALGEKKEINNLNTKPNTLAQFNAAVPEKKKLHNGRENYKLQVLPVKKIETPWVLTAYATQRAAREKRLNNLMLLSLTASTGRASLNRGVNLQSVRANPLDSKIISTTPTSWYNKGDHIDTIKKWLLKQEEHREKSFMFPHLEVSDTSFSDSGVHIPKINKSLTVCGSPLNLKGGDFKRQGREVEEFSYISQPSGVAAKALNSLFNFEIDNKGINKYNKLGLRKILSKFKFFRYFRYSGVHTGYKQIISYYFSKNDSRTNALNSFDHTGSLLKVSISVILKYFFKLMGLALISKPIFIFNHNKITIQISYYINKKVYFLNNNAKSSLLYLMIYNNNAMFGKGKSNLTYNLYKIYNSMLGRPYSTNFYTDVKALNWKYLDDDWKYIYNSAQAKDPKTSKKSKKYLYRSRVNKHSRGKTFKNKNKQSALTRRADGYTAQLPGATRGLKGRVRGAGRVSGEQKKKNLLNEFLYFTNPLYSDKVPFLDIQNNFSKKKFLKLPLDYNFYSQTPIKNTLSNFYSEFNSLTYILETFFNCSIKLELNRLDNPYSESNIMAQLIGINGKDYTFEKIKSIFFPKFYYLNPNTLIKPLDFEPKTNKRPFAICSGIKIRVAGRFYLHRIIPKKTVSTVQLGSMARGVISLVEKSRYTNKSKRGSFSVTVWISHTY